MIKKGKYIAVRPNTLIEARYDLTAKQNDILDIVLSKVDDDNNYLYELNITDYRHFYKTNTSNIYRDLKRAVKEFEGKGFYLIDNQNKKEIFFSWFASILYSDAEGKIILEVGQRFKKLLLEMKKRIYYKIEYPLNFKSIYSKRIYYYLKSFENTGWRIDNLDKLRIKLQCPKSYNKYSFFKMKVLDMAHKEINNYSDIYFEYEEIKTGRKVTALKFIIKPNKARKEIAVTVVEEESQQRSIEDIEKVQAIFEEKITPKEARKIYNAASGDIGLIKAKYNLAKQSNDIKNIVGWIIKAIKEDYSTPKSKNNQGSFCDYEQRSIDFDKLERKLLGWDND